MIHREFNRISTKHKKIPSLKHLNTLCQTTLLFFFFLLHTFACDGVLHVCVIPSEKATCWWFIYETTEIKEKKEIRCKKEPK